MQAPIGRPRSRCGDIVGVGQAQLLEQRPGLFEAAARRVALAAVGERASEHGQGVGPVLAEGAARIGYDLPSSIMSRFGSEEIGRAAGKLDERLVAFATELAGAPA